MKYFIAVIAALFFAIVTNAQKAAVSAPDFDVIDFEKKFETAQFLVEYDNVAWKTTDVVMQQDKKELERLGEEWFAFKDKNGKWHAVYGKLVSSGYEKVFHYEMDAAEKIVASTAKVEKGFLDTHAKALSTARAKLLTQIPEGSPRFNQYIRRNADNTFSVWLLPAFQTNGVAVYGGEGIYTIDAAGTKILKDESYFQTEFRGFRSSPPREIWLDFKEMDKPSLGAIFFVWYYKPYFTQIYIDNKKSTSTLIKSKDGYIWTHVVKEPDAGSKSK